MTRFWERLKQRKLVQWALAYVAAAFALLQGVDIVAQQFGWPETLQRGITLAMVLGFFVALVLAWYHGEKGEQSVSTTELLILAVLLAVGGGLMWRYAGTTAPGVTATGVVVNPASSPVVPTADTAIPAKSIAVLPFENLSEEKGNKYFADGMQDLILTKLADIGALKVISRTSTMKYASHPDDLKIIAQQLGVATILEGSVQKAGNQVLINVQLIDAKTDAHLWAESYTRTLDNIFGVEGEVAQKIAEALKAKLSPTETKRLATNLSSNPDANDLFLRAEYLSDRAAGDFDAAGFMAAIALYRQALEKDKDFVLARARLSFAESGAVWFGSGGDGSRQLAADAAAQAEQALAQQPDLVASQLALGYSAYWGQQDYATALIAFTKVLKLRPNDAGALAARGYVLRRQGHYDAAIDSMQQALTFDPRNSAVAETLAETYQTTSRYAEAERYSRLAMALDPDNFQARGNYSNGILLGSGDVERALAAAQGDKPVLQLSRVQLLTYQRKYRDALALLEVIPDTPDNFFYQVGPKALLQANLYRLAGDTARAQPLYVHALAQSRAQLVALAGKAIKLSFVWNHIASAELGLGKTDATLASIAKSGALATQSGDVFFGTILMLSNAILYAEAGRPELAVPLLEKSLAMPGIGGFYSPVMLWIDPAWDPIRHDPRFEALLKKYASAKPAAVAP
jgi:TolB-like protein/Tfp pilus assembly protein PilF